MFYHLLLEEQDKLTKKINNDWHICIVEI